MTNLTGYTTGEIFPISGHTWMLMKSVITRCLYYSLVCVVFACHDKDDVAEDTSTYTWIPSSITTNDEWTVYKFKKSQDGDLYISGWGPDEKSIFAKRVGSQWEIIAKVDEMVIGDYAVFQDTVYYSSSLAVKKSRGTYVETFLNTYTHTAIEVFQDKLFISGSYLACNGEEYTILSYDATKKCNPIFQGVSNARMKVAKSRLFIASTEGHPLLIYYDGFLEESAYKKDFLNIDNEGSIYSQEDSDPKHIVITKFINQKTEKIGNDLPMNMILTRLEFNGSSVVISGGDLVDDTSNAFFLTINNTWKPIDTGFVIYDLINFDGKVLAASDGMIMELVKS